MSAPGRGFDGVDPSWSRTVTAPDADGVPRRWHLLDTGTRHTSAPHTGETDSPCGTVLCVHGNPTWSYLWRRVLAATPPGWRAIAVDQLGMGYSEHPAGSLREPRRLAQRVDDLARLVDALHLSGPLVVAGHDWGGIVGAGLAERLDAENRLAGLVLSNTAVHHNFDSGLPGPLSIARHPALIRTVCVQTPAFVRAATAVSRPRPSKPVRDAYAAPYSDAPSRTFVGQFVADIPAEPTHPTRATLDAIAAGLPALANVPILLIRGVHDPVFSETHLRDLRARVPHAQVHRYEHASHLVWEDAPQSTDDLWRWIAAEVESQSPDSPTTAQTDDVDTAARPPAPDTAVGASDIPWLALTETAATRPDEICVVEMGSGRTRTFAELERDVAATASGLRQHGVRSGDRVALLVPPGIDLTVAVYAVWRVGAVIVVADAGLGVRSLGRALRGAGPDHVIGIRAALAACAPLRIPGERILAGDAPAPLRRLIGATTTLDELRRRGASSPVTDAHTSGDAECAVLFTSGATGPSKGVVYRVDALRTMIGHVGGIYELEPGDRLVAAFAPFALYGPALGIGAVVPDMDVTAPGTLTAAALADAVIAADATVVFASPAALRNVLATANALTPTQRAALVPVRAVMSAGAPVSQSLMRALGAVLPNAVPHTPYGMTEVLPVSDITLPQLEDAGPGNPNGIGRFAAGGVCVGHPLPGVEVQISPLPDDPGQPDGPLTDTPGVTGEIIVRASHVKDRYDQLWATTEASTPTTGVHRSGDVGHLDEQGRLWVEGRRVHVLHTSRGPVTPVELEQAVEQLDGVHSAAVVGVGPVGVQQPVVIVQLERGYLKAHPSPLSRHASLLAPPELADVVRRLAADREAGALDIAAVLVIDAMPVDIRHQSKIDRTALADWASAVLAGRSGRRKRARQP